MKIRRQYMLRSMSQIAARRIHAGTRKRLGDEYNAHGGVLDRCGQAPRQNGLLNTLWPWMTNSPGIES